MGNPGCEVVADIENLEQYSKATQEVACNVISLFGTDDFGKKTMFVGSAFSFEELSALINNEKLELQDCQMRPTQIKDDYRVICKEYPDEEVHVIDGEMYVNIQHSVNRLD